MGQTVRTPELEKLILDGISEGVTLRELCRKHGIGKSSVYRWRDEDKKFAGRFARAREIGFDALAEETLEIAEDGSNDWIERQRQDGSAYDDLNHEHVQRSKLRIETRLKLLSKWDPKRYGDAMQLRHADADGNKLNLAEVIAQRRRKVAEDRGDEA